MSNQKTWSEASALRKFAAVFMFTALGGLIIVLSLIVFSYATREEETRLNPTATTESTPTVEPVLLPTAPAGWTVNKLGLYMRVIVSDFIYGRVFEHYLEDGVWTCEIRVDDDIWNGEFRAAHQAFDFCDGYLDELHDAVKEDLK